MHHGFDFAVAVRSVIPDRCSCPTLLRRRQAMRRPRSRSHESCSAKSDAASACPCMEIAGSPVQAVALAKTSLRPGTGRTDSAYGPGRRGHSLCHSQEHVIQRRRCPTLTHGATKVKRAFPASADRARIGSVLRQCALRTHPSFAFDRRGVRLDRRHYPASDARSRYMHAIVATATDFRAAVACHRVTRGSMYSNTIQCRTVLCPSHPSTP